MCCIDGPEGMTEKLQEPAVHLRSNAILTDLLRCKGILLWAPEDGEKKQQLAEGAAVDLPLVATRGNTELNILCSQISRCF